MRKSDKTAAVILATLTIVISWLTHIDYNIIASEGLTLSSIVLAVYVAAIFIEKRASSCPQSLEKSRFFSYPLLTSEGENSQNVKRIFLRKVVI